MYCTIKHIDTLIAAIIGYLAVYMFTRYSGVGISPDSIMYASTATNIQAHGSLMTFNGTPLVFFPVFYPFFLGVIQFVSGVDPFTAGPVINGALFGLVILLTGFILERYVNYTRLYKWLVLTAVILSPALLEIYSFLWSETLFIFEVVLFILVYQYYRQRKTINSLAVITLIGAIACITRYAGITLIGAGGLIMLSDNQLIIRNKVKHLLIFGVGSVTLLVGNLILNSINTGLSTGKRLPSITSLSENLHYAGAVFCQWAGFKEGFDSYYVAVAVIIFLFLTIFLVYKTLLHRKNNPENIIIAFAFFYGAFIVLLATFSRFERLNSRLLSPMFIPLLISSTVWAPPLISAVRSKAKYALSGVAILLMLAFNYSILQVDLQRYDDEMDYGVPGYSDDSWNTSPFASFLKTHKNIFKPGIPIYTNADEAFYLFTGRTSILVPHRFFKNDVAKFYQTKSYYYIWFKPLDNVELIDIKDIMKVHQLNKLHDFPDGAIYLHANGSDQK